MDTNEEKKKTSVFSKIIMAISIVIIVIALVIIARVVIFNKYDVFGYNLNIIRSGSMKPTINIMDVVVTKESNDYQKGDIISFVEKGDITVHRIINVNNENNQITYTTKGDANNKEDSNPVKKENVKGKVVMTIPNVGNAAMFVQKNLPIILVVIAGILIIVILVRRLI